MKNAKTLFIVHKDEHVRIKMKRELLSLSGVEIKCFDNGGDCLKSINSNTILVILETDLRDLNGLDVLQILKIKNPDLDVVMLADNDDVETALHYLKSGAKDYLLHDETAIRRILNLLERKKTGPVFTDDKIELHPMNAFLLLSFTTIAVVITLLMKYYN